MPRKAIDLSGNIFGCWIVHKDFIRKGYKNKIYYKCECKYCHKIEYKRADSLKNPKSISCLCLRERNRQHYPIAQIHTKEAKLKSKKSTNAITRCRLDRKISWLPRGILLGKNKRKQTYTVRVQDKHNNKTLGTFDDLLEAMRVYANWKYEVGHFSLKEWYQYLEQYEK